MPINYNDFDESAVYTFYHIHDTTVKHLQKKTRLSPEEEKQLEIAVANMYTIEEYSKLLRAKGLRWSLPSLFQARGMNPTLILELYPGSEGYKKFGKEIVANVEYSDEDLKFIIESIRDQALRVNSILKFKLVPEFTDQEISTGDIYGVR